MVRLKDNLYCIVLIRSRIFQFLMVRLKGIVIININKHIKISIPYGAIKSICLQNLRDVGIIFQFLMVRLKAAALAN